MMAQKLMSDNKDNPFNSRFFQPSDAYSKQQTRPIQGDLTLGNLASYFMPFSKDIGPYEDSPKLNRPGGVNIDFPPIVKDAVSGINKFGQVFRGELSQDEIKQLAFDTSLNVTGGSLVGSKLLKNAVPKDALSMGLTTKATKSLDNAGEVAKVVPPTDKTDGIFAFHGSPGNFDEFKLSKINTGEGAQAFGHGLYFTDSKDIAKFYKDSVSFQKGMEGQSLTYNGEIINVRDMQNLNVGLRKVMGALSDATPMNYPIKKDPEGLVKKTVETLTKKYRQEIKDLRSGEMGDFTDSSGFSNNERSALALEKQLNEIEKVDLSKVGELDPKTYEVKINAVIDDLLDFNLPLSEQSESVKKAIESLKMNISPKTKGSQIYEQIGSVLSEPPFNNTISNTANPVTSKKISEKLNSLNIKGIKYKAGLLTSGQKDSKATNYVIFDDKIIDIMAKYGIVGAIGVSAMQRGSGASEGDILPPGAI